MGLHVPKSVGTWVKGQENARCQDKAITINANKDGNLRIML